MPKEEVLRISPSCSKLLAINEGFYAALLMMDAPCGLAFFYIPDSRKEILHKSVDY
jgi:hypothetical protein